MAFEDLQDQIKEKWAELRGQIEESPAFNTLRERYETLSPQGQLGVKAGAIAFIVMVLIYFPYSYFSTSSDNVTIFQEKRSLIRKLLQASRMAGDSGAVDNPPPSSALIENIRSQLGTFNLVDEQIGEITNLPNEALGGRYSASKEIEQEGIGVTLKKLNLKQVVEIGHSLQSSLGQGVRLVGMDVKAGAPDPHYFDVLFKIARFSLPMSAPDNKATGRGNGKRSGTPEKSSDAEAEE